LGGGGIKGEGHYERLTALSVARMRLPALGLGENWPQSERYEEGAALTGSAPIFFMD